MISFPISLFYISVHTAKCDSYEDCEFMVVNFSYVAAFKLF